MTKKLIGLFVICSSLFHIGSYWASFTIDIPEPYFNLPKPVEVDLIERPVEKPDLNRPALRFAEAPKELKDESLEALRKNAAILSEKVQRVKKEMRANLFGLTKNRWQTPPKSKSSVQDNLTEKPTTREEGLGDIKLKVEKQESQSNPIDLAPSTFGNQIKNKVEVGNFTALNTDRHLYYSFYARIEEMIRPPWEDHVIYEMRKNLKDLRLVPKGGWSTRIDVILNSQGRLQKVVLLKGSSFQGYDNAAINAFQKAGFFPHPPKEMVSEDGTITLKYIFTVY